MHKLTNQTLCQIIFPPETPANNHFAWHMNRKQFNYFMRNDKDHLLSANWVVLCQPEIRVSMERIGLMSLTRLVFFVSTCFW